MPQIWNFARNSDAAIDQAGYDCTVGFINTYAHDVIIPQGGVHGGQPAGQLAAVQEPAGPPALPAGQDARSQVLRLPGDRAQAVLARAADPGDRRQQHGPPTHPDSSTTCPGP